MKKKILDKYRVLFQNQLAMRGVTHIVNIVRFSHISNVGSSTWSLKIGPIWDHHSWIDFLFLFVMGYPSELYKLLYNLDFEKISIS